MRILRTLLLLCFLSSIATAQTTLQVGTPIERELGPGQAHEFTVSLEENSFVQLVVEQRGIDVIVRVASPSGKSLGDFDSPNGNDGPENVSFVAVAAGNYRVSVGPLESKEGNTGKYQIKILEVRQATEQELKTAKNVEVTKARGIALLSEIEATILQIKSPQTRIKAQMQAAQLLWDIDDKRASRFLNDAMAGLREYLSSIDPTDLMYRQSPVWQLRQEVLFALAQRDPDAALSLLQSTGQFFSAVTDQREMFRQESSIELAIADQAIRNNPSRTLQIARQNLKRGYSSNLMNTLTQLRRQNPEMSAELGNEIASKLLSEKLLKTPEASFLAIGLVQLARGSENRSQSPNGGGTPPIITEEKYNDLLRKMFEEASSYSQPAQATYDEARDIAINMLNTLKSMAGQVDPLVPGGVSAVDKKLTELYSDTRYARAYVNFSLNSSELTLESIAKMPPEAREQQYIQLASNEANAGDAARAKQIINEHVSNPFQRRQTLLNLDQMEVARAMGKGKAEDALRTLSGFRNIRERAQQLSQIASQIGPGYKRTTALNLLEQARGLLGPSPQAQDQDQMYALFEIARSFARYDVKRSFEIIDPLIDQFNELSLAARTLDGFGPDYYDGDELDLTNGNSLAEVVNEMSTVLGNIAMINFDRAKLTTDRLRPPEVRLKAYLEIAQQTIKAAK